MREREAHFGIQGVDLTTAMHLFNPEQAFALADQLNKNRPDHLRASIEVYPTIGRAVLEPARKGAASLGLQLPMTPTVSVDQIRQWQKQYPLARVSRIHLPFSYNAAELWHRPFFGEKGLKDRAYQIAWILYFGAATNEKGIKIAEELSKDGQEVGINAHTNVIEGFARDGRLEEIKQRIPFVLAENERRYNSPILKGEAIWNPVVIVDRIIKRYGLDGLVLGVDHGFGQGLDMTGALNTKGIREQTRAMHLAKTNPGVQHDLIAVGDRQFEGFLRRSAITSFSNPVRAALDYGPETMKGKSGQEQVGLIRETIDWIMSIQRG